MQYFSVFILFVSLCFTQAGFATKNTVYVYADEGVSKTSLKHTLHSFRRVLGSCYQLKTIDANTVKTGTWREDAALFIMPGGADLPYVKKLHGQGNKHIREFVHAGGAYLGFCAGAYYASSEVEFDKGGPLQVIGERELRFFQGKAIGPGLAPYDYQSEKGARAAKVSLSMLHPTEMTVYYNGGGYFEHAEKVSNTQVIGYYNNHLPAIVFVRSGEGRVLLTGVHFEYDASLLDAKDVYLSRLIEELKLGEHARQSFLQQALELLDVGSASASWRCHAWHELGRTS